MDNTTYEYCFYINFSQQTNLGTQQPGILKIILPDVAEGSVNIYPTDNIGLGKKEDEVKSFTIDKLNATIYCGNGGNIKKRSSNGIRSPAHYVMLSGSDIRGSPRLYLLSLPTQLVNKIPPGKSIILTYECIIKMRNHTGRRWLEKSDLKYNMTNCIYDNKKASLLTIELKLFGGINTATLIKQDILSNINKSSLEVDAIMTLCDMKDNII